ncbi:hypothetical protein RND71_021681 [Anisodus tanguticus]|uniref:Uncharacterized protein n=1 Tax=Anisodus tanguticus TaxID=243964 RepID=A0AAE1V8G4_9SOLA|nr:hypothetical protein RND71_021681 [Anisodus tanguticus]
MAKFLALLIVLFVAIASDKRVVPVVYGKQCVGDIGYNVCTPIKSDRCMPLCIQATGAHISTATCMIHSDGSSYCECVWKCSKHIHEETQLKITTTPAPAPY